MRYRIALALALLWLLAACLRPLPAHAAEIDTGARSAHCDEAARLAGIVQAEAYSQPTRAQQLIAAIVVNEARSRGMDVCALSEQTNFVSVWHYAQAHPASWHARQFAAPTEWALELAKAQLLIQAGNSVVPLSAHHFDGRAHADDVFTIGGTHFQP